MIELARYFAKQPKQKRGHPVPDFRRRGVGTARVGILGGAPGTVAGQRRRDDQHGHDRAGAEREDLCRRIGHRLEFPRAARPDHAEVADLKVDYAEGPESGSSDHTSFIAKKVPSLFFFSGLHSDYHKPSDTWDKIDAPAAAKAAATGGGRDGTAPGGIGPAAVHASRAPAPHGGGTGDAGPVSGYGPWFGSVPDFGEGIQGVKFADVSAGSPAAKAGLQAGDIMVAFDGKAIQNLYDFTYALRGKKPGDEVVVKVMRDGKPLEVKVLLSRRG